MVSWPERDIGLYQDALMICETYGDRAPATRLGKAYDELGAAVTQRLRKCRWSSIYAEFSRTWNDLEPLPQHPLIVTELRSDWEPS